MAVEVGQLTECLERAYEVRGPLLASFVDDSGESTTDAYRLFHGVQEGVPGLAIDRYGALLLVQTFHRDGVLGAHGLEAIASVYDGLLPEPVSLVYNHRGKPKSSSFAEWHEPLPEALETMVCRELGVSYLNRARHRGLDQMFFLDFRVVRRWLQANAEGRSLLNLFSYTGTAGICAAVSGATEVWNVDFAASAHEWGREQAALHESSKGTISWVQEDIFPVLRQLAGLPLKGRGRSRRGAKFQKFEARQFDLVILDPPTWAKSRWGAVDIVRDYQSLFKPALLAVADGGVLVATNHAAAVARDEWLDILSRCAAKAGRPLKEIEVLVPEADFPSLDQNPLLKIALCRV